MRIISRLLEVFPNSNSDGGIFAVLLSNGTVVAKGPWVVSLKDGIQFSDERT